MPFLWSVSLSGAMPGSNVVKDDWQSIRLRLKKVRMLVPVHKSIYKGNQQKGVNGKKLQLAVKDLLSSERLLP